MSDIKHKDEDRRHPKPSHTKKWSQRDTGLVEDKKYGKDSFGIHVDQGNNKGQDDH